MAEQAARIERVRLDDPRVREVAADEVRSRLPDAGAGVIEPLVAMQLDSKIGTLRAQHPDAVVELLSIDGAPVGYAVIHAGAEAVRLCDIAVVLEARGRGNGRMLMDRVLAAADADGAVVKLSVWPGSPAHHWYTRLGFDATSAVAAGHVEMRRAAAE